jgi:hypothetical protein
MDFRTTYHWQMETVDGQILSQYEADGKENTWKVLPIEKIIRCSFLPSVPGFPRHDVLIDLAAGEQFVRRFGRGFLKQTKEGIQLKEYLNCCVTQKYRFYVIHSCGRTLVTRQDYEVYL